MAKFYVMCIGMSMGQLIPMMYSCYKKLVVKNEVMSQFTRRNHSLKNMYSWKRQQLTNCDLEKKIIVSESNVLI